MIGNTFDVVGIGENSVDVVCRIPGLPSANSKMPITSRRLLTGGQVATAMCTCARLGVRASYVGTFGNDDQARTIRETLQAYGVDTAHALTRDVPNRCAVILIDDRTGERSVLWERDPALVLRPDDLPLDVIRAARVVHVDNIDEETAIAAARLARAAGAEVTTDIDVITARTPDLVAAATFPIFAEHVPAALTGEPDPERALRQLRQRHDGRLCVTLGARGALMLDGDRLYQTAGFAVEAVDTTGAGDVFRGALIVALLRGDGPEEMLRFACAAAAVSCTREGAIGGVPSAADVTEVLTTKA